MKRLLVYTTQLMQTGGIESHLLEFCSNMSQNGVSVDLVVLNSKVLPQTLKLFKGYCRCVYIGRQTQPFLRLLWLLGVGLKLRLKNYDALYTNGQGSSVGFFAAIVTSRESWVHHHHTAGDAIDQASWGRPYWRTLRNATTVIACSGRNARDMAKALGRETNTIPCFSRKVKSLETIIKTQAAKVKLGYYGRLIPEKGIDLLSRFSTDSELSDVEFHIWGEGDAYPASYFTDFPNLHYHGSFNGLAELTTAINHLNGFLLLSTHPEGLPISLLEAMGAGLPWLSSNKGGIADIACDPLSTRLIESVIDYDVTKAAVKLFAEDIAAGKVSRKVQENLYDEKFSAKALVLQWKIAFKF